MHPVSILFHCPSRHSSIQTGSPECADPTKHFWSLFTLLPSGQHWGQGFVFASLVQAPFWHTWRLFHVAPSGQFSRISILFSGQHWGQGFGLFCGTQAPFSHAFWVFHVTPSAQYSGSLVWPTVHCGQACDSCFQVPLWHTSRVFHVVPSAQ